MNSLYDPAGFSALARRALGTAAALTALVVALSVAAADSAGETSSPAAAEWEVDFAAASARAAAEGRAILLNFTGSDWCVWCHRLRDEVFAQKPFGEYAAAHLVLVEVDFPRRKPLDEPRKTQNRQLAERFGIDGYPTVVVLNSAGDEIGRLGYMQGGAKTFVRELKRLISADTRRPEASAPSMAGP